MYVMSEKFSIISLLSANFHQIYTDSSLNCLLGEGFQTLIILVTHFIGPNTLTNAS